MGKVWAMFWNMLLTLFTAVDDGVAVIGIATKVARDEMDGTSKILAIDRDMRHTNRVNAAKAAVAEFSKDLKATKP